MDKFLIDGPCKIKGKVLISGSKNASLPILAATLLFDQPVIIKNLPRVKDIDTMISLLRSLGSKIILSKNSDIQKIVMSNFYPFDENYNLIGTIKDPVSSRQYKLYKPNLNDNVKNK